MWYLDLIYPSLLLRSKFSQSPHIKDCDLEFLICFLLDDDDSEIYGIHLCEECDSRPDFDFGVTRVLEVSKQ